MTQFPANQFSFLRFLSPSNPLALSQKPLNVVPHAPNNFSQDQLASISQRWNMMDKMSPKATVSIPLFPKPFEEENLPSTQGKGRPRAQSLGLSDLKIPEIAYQNHESLQRSSFAVLQNHRINELTNLIQRSEENIREMSPKKRLHSQMLTQSKKIAKYLSENKLGNKNGFYSRKESTEESSQRLSNRHRNRRNPWRPSEDMKLLELVKVYGECWAMISSKMSDRTGKQIRDRYLNILRPNLKKGEWSQNEDFLLVSLYYSFGHKWSLIAKHMPGRSEAQVKNRFYSHVKKRLNSEFPKEIKIPRFIPEEEISPSYENESTQHDENEWCHPKLEETEEIKAEVENEVKLEEHGEFSNIVKEHTRRYKEIFRKNMDRMKNNSKRQDPPPLVEEGRTIPINEKEVDMVLEILARYYQSLPSHFQSPQEDDENGQRLQQLNVRKNQLEYLLNKTVQEMEKLQ